MTKQDFILKVAKNTGKDREEVRDMVNAIIETASDVIVSGEDISFNEFGSFKVMKRASRPYMDFKTHRMVKSGEKMAIRFVPSSKLVDRLNAEKADELQAGE